MLYSLSLYTDNDFKTVLLSFLDTGGEPRIDFVPSDTILDEFEWRQGNIEWSRFTSSIARWTFVHFNFHFDYYRCCCTCCCEVILIHYLWQKNIITSIWETNFQSNLRKSAQLFILFNQDNCLTCLFANIRKVIEIISVLYK